jgi:hypothetical protein
MPNSQKKNTRAPKCILRDFCCNPGVYTVEHPEDGHMSDQNM